MTFVGPLFWHELRRLPRRRLHLWRVLYAIALLLGLLVVYIRAFRELPTLEALTNPNALDRIGGPAFAERFLIVFLVIQQIAVVVLTPLSTAASICAEKERRTLDFLLSSPLPHGQILIGKLFARLWLVGNVLATGFPILMLAFFFGGIDFERLLAGFVIAVVTAFYLGTMGLMQGCRKSSFRETLSGIIAVVLVPSFLSLCSGCHFAFAAGSPVSILAYLIIRWTYSPEQDDNWPPVLLFAVLHLLLCVPMLRFAHRVLNDQSPPDQPENPRREFINSQLDYLNPSIRRVYEVPKFNENDTNPILWHAKFFHKPWNSPERGCASMLFVTGMGTLVFLGLSASFIILLDDLAHGRAIGRMMNILAQMFLVPTACFYPGFVAVRIAGAVGRERAQQTLETLFTLPIDRAEILHNHARAILYRDRYWLIFIVALLSLAAATGGVSLTGGLATCLFLGGCIAFGIGFGLWLSTIIDRPTAASLIAAAGWGGFLILPWFAASFFGTDVREFIQYLCPPYGIQASLSFDRTSPINPSAIEAGYSAGSFLFVIAGLLVRMAEGNLNREGRR